MSDRQQPHQANAQNKQPSSGGGGVPSDTSLQAAPAVAAAAVVAAPVVITMEHLQAIIRPLQAQLEELQRFHAAGPVQQAQIGVDRQNVLHPIDQQALQERPDHRQPVLPPCPILLFKTNNFLYRIPSPRFLCNQFLPVLTLLLSVDFLSSHQVLPLIFL